MSHFFYIHIYLDTHFFLYISCLVFYNNLTINRKDLIPWIFFWFKKKKILFHLFFFIFIIFFFLHLATMLQVQYLAKLYMAFEKRGIKDVHKSNFNITLWRQQVVNSTKIHFKYMFT